MPKPNHKQKLFDAGLATTQRYIQGNTEAKRRCLKWVKPGSATCRERQPLMALVRTRACPLYEFTRSARFASTALAKPRAVVVSDGFLMGQQDELAAASPSEGLAVIEQDDELMVVGKVPGSLFVAVCSQDRGSQIQTRAKAATSVSDPGRARQRQIGRQQARISAPPPLQYPSPHPQSRAAVRQPIARTRKGITKAYRRNRSARPMFPFSTAALPHPLQCRLSSS
jgi:hypothetical protein